MLTKSITQRILFSMYIVAVFISVLLCDVKYRSLGFHTRDYAFYLEFSSKLLNDNSAHTYSINPEGRNWLFMDGIEGIRDIHQSLHFEPIKYLYAVLYKVFETPYALFIFIALIFFIPLPYMAFAMPMNSQQEMRNALSLGVLYLLPPAAIYAPTFDLRPFIFMAPFFLLTILSIQFSRPAWEQILFFNLLFLAREESIILGAVLLLFSVVDKRSRNVQPKVFLAICISYLIWIAATAAFMWWTGYPVQVEELPTRAVNVYKKLIGDIPLLVSGLVMGCVIVFPVLWFLWKKFKDQPRFHAVIDILAVGSVFIPLGYQLTSEYMPSKLIMFLFIPRYYLHYIALLLFLFVIQMHFRPIVSERIWLGFITISVTAIIVLNTAQKDGLLTIYTQFSHATQDASQIWSFRENLDSYKAKVLVDYATHQAFYNFENVYSYNRLPWAMLSGTRRLYPDNKKVVVSLIDREIDYIIISRASIIDIENILEGSSVQKKVLFENEQFIGLEIIRK